MAVGVGAGEHPLTIPLLLAAGLGVVLAICLWWLYFDLVAAATGRRVAELAGTERIRIAFEAYVYGHFPLVAGVLLAAVGVEGALRLAGTDESLGAFYGLCLVGGVALHLIGHLIFDRRVQRARSVARACAPVSYTHLDVYKRQVVALAHGDRHHHDDQHRHGAPGDHHHDRARPDGDRHRRQSCLLYTSRES